MKNIKICENPADTIRKERAKICFPIVNRGKLWYDCLTLEQLSDLRKWYWEWLDAPETLTYPIMPEWLEDKLTREEILL